MKTKKLYQVWALLYNERGTEVWRPVTRPYANKAGAMRAESNIWLKTRIDEIEPEEEDD